MLALLVFAGVAGAMVGPEFVHSVPLTGIPALLLLLYGHAHGRLVYVLPEKNPR